MLREMRLKKGLTQDQLARKLNMTSQNLRNYELYRYMEMSPILTKKVKRVLGEEFEYVRKDSE